MQQYYGFTGKLIYSGLTGESPYVDFETFQEAPSLVIMITDNLVKNIFL
jgi:hypothetical protein